MGMNTGEFSTIGFDTERMFVYNIFATNCTNFTNLKFCHELHEFHELKIKKFVQIREIRGQFKIKNS